MDKSALRKKARSLPLLPGVYLMLDKNGGVLYVGKAKQLKNRVSSYFQDTEQTPKTQALVSLIHDFDFIVADSEFEALVLESSLIKRHQPKYNILLKDGKGYPFIRISHEEYPRLSMVGRPTEKDGARYFGPYAGRKATQQAIMTLTEILRLPVCEKKFPRDFGKERPCLQYHMGRCVGLCRGDVSSAEYQALVRQGALLMEGRQAGVLQSLKTEMEQASEALLFEKAAMLRDRIRAIETLGHKQKVVSGSMVDTDVIGTFPAHAKTCVAVLHYVEGSLFSRDIHWLGLETDVEVISAFVKQYYPARGVLPRFICLPCPLEDADEVTQLLITLTGEKSKTELLVPKRGDKLALVKMAIRNAREEVERVSTKEEKVRKTLSDLTKLLKLPEPPGRMEAYDISHTGEENRVGAMVVYVDGAPKKGDYRLFKIKDDEARDDLSALREVLTRRFTRLRDGDEKFSVAPDLLLIDGGALQASAVQEVVTQFALSIPVFGMVKDDRHRTRGLVTPEGEEIGLSAHPSLFALIGGIQEETHRAAITFHRKKREKTASRLDDIPGIGPVRRKALFKSFHSLAGIKRASLDELSEVLPLPVAAAVKAALEEEKH